MNLKKLKDLTLIYIAKVLTLNVSYKGSVCMNVTKKATELLHRTSAFIINIICANSNITLKTMHKATVLA